LDIAIVLIRFKLVKLKLFDPHFLLGGLVLLLDDAELALLFDDAEFLLNDAELLLDDAEVALDLGLLGDLLQSNMLPLEHALLELVQLCLRVRVQQLPPVLAAVGQRLNRLWRGVIRLLLLLALAVLEGQALSLSLLLVGVQLRGDLLISLVAGRGLSLGLVLKLVETLLVDLLLLQSLVQLERDVLVLAFLLLELLL
jgi:hypothetical protein